MKKLNALIIALTLASTLFTFYSATAYLVKTYTIQMQGNIYAIGVEVFWDSQCTNKCETVDWGWLHPGESKNITLYLRNSGNTPVTLTLSTENWLPAEAADYISLTWDREGYYMTEQTIACLFTLTVSDAIQNTTIQSFSFDAVITATET